MQPKKPSIKNVGQARLPVDLHICIPTVRLLINTVIAKGTSGKQLAQWEAIKKAASMTIIEKWRNDYASSGGR